MRLGAYFFATLTAGCISLGPVAVDAGQAPGSVADPDIAVSHEDRVYAAEQFSNTVSVTDPASNKLLGVIRLGDTQPANFSPLYRGQVLVHGMGFSPDHKTLAVVAIGSNSVTFIDTETNSVKQTTYLGRSPQEACKEAVMRIVRKRREASKTLQVGFLAMNRDGEAGAYAIQHGFAYAMCDAQKQDGLIPAQSVYSTSYS